MYASVNLGWRFFMRPPREDEIGVEGPHYWPEDLICLDGGGYGFSEQP